ncbi:MAG: HEPN domain-containing protein [archaeon]
MDSEGKIYLNRAEDEFLLAKKDLDLSTKDEVKAFLGIPKEKTFYNSVITHAYYSIFYCAKAYLLNKGIKTPAFREHMHTYNEFKKLVETNKLSQELLQIYDNALDKAESLLKIFFDEKRKRGRFVYNIKAESNLFFANESVENAKKFISTIKTIL